MRNRIAVLAAALTMSAAVGGTGHGFDVGLIPRFGWVRPEDVARDALRAVATGRPGVVPGIVSRAVAVFGTRMPRSVLRAAGRHVFSETGDGYQREVHHGD